MLHISYKLKIGKSTYRWESQSSLLSLQVNLSLNIPVNNCYLVFGNPEDISVFINDPVSIELGYGQNLSLVFSGMVSLINWGIDRVELECYGKFQILTTARLNLLFEKSTAGDIVKNIAENRLNLQVAKLESGIKFPVYVLGDRQTAYNELQTLADKCGFDFYADHQDAVIFAKYKPQTTHEFKYKENILACQLAQTTTNIAGVQVYGESPASQGQGEEAYTWLTKKDIKGVAGKQSGIVERLFEPTARSEDIANKIATSILAAKTHKRSGIVKVIGESKLKLGDAVKISDLPVKSQNGTFKITGIKHILNQTKGWMTIINWEET